MVAMGIRTYGPNAVDWEQRIDVDRLRRDRLARLKATLGRSELGSLLTFDFHNMRYMTSTHIGTWAMDKLIRFALLPRDGRPDQPELGRARAGISTLRGAFNPDAGIAEEVARKIRRVLDEHGLAGEPVGVDLVEMPILAALQAAGLTVVDGQQAFLEARRIKTDDEIGLLTQAVSMVDAAYDQLYSFLRPGVRENECVGLVAKVLYDLGSEHGGHRLGLAAGRGVRLPQRGGRLRAAVRPRRRPVHLGEADLQPAGLARPPGGARGGHAVRARDLLDGRRPTARRARGRVPPQPAGSGRPAGYGGRPGEPVRP